LSQLASSAAEIGSRGMAYWAVQYLAFLPTNLPTYKTENIMIFEPQ
jgi:hypothetical protein